MRQGLKHWTGLLLGVLIFGIGTPSCAAPLFPVPEDANPLPLTSFSTFQSLSDTQLGALQVKITYVGWRTAVGSPVCFAMSLGQIDVTKFRPFWRKHQFYWDEYNAPHSFAVSQAQMRAVISNVGAIAGVVDGGVDPHARVIFAIEGNVGGTDQVFESVLDATNGKAMFSALLSALVGNPQGADVVKEMACEHALLQGPAPTEKTSSALITYSGIRYDRTTGDAVGAVTVKNTGSTSLAAPVLLVISSTHANVQPINPSGITCLIKPPRPYFIISVSSPLAPGASITQVIHFTNPDLEPVDVTARVFAGAGTP